ncbi:hypothetical protein Droror1_Dr00011786 [Drosera rotundifolia]
MEEEKELKNVISQLEKQLKEYQLSEESLKPELETLKIESVQKLELEEKLKELEQQFATAEAQLKDEVQNVRTASVAREADLTSNLEQQGHKVQDGDALNEKLLQLQQELQLAQTTIVELKEEKSRQASEQEGAIKNLSEELAAKSQEALLLEKQTTELQEKLQAVSTEKGQDAAEVSSQDIGSSVVTPSKRKSKKKTETSTSSQALPASEKSATSINASSSAMNFKLVLGVALFSIIVGIILGKRYKV